MIHDILAVQNIAREEPIEYLCERKQNWTKPTLLAELFVFPIFHGERRIKFTQPFEHANISKFPIITNIHFLRKWFKNPTYYFSEAS